MFELVTKDGKSVASLDGKDLANKWEKVVEERKNVSSANRGKK